MLMGALSGGSALPFWATAGSYGLMPDSSGAMMLVQAGTQFDGSKTLQWRWGGSLAAGNYSDAVAPRDVLVDELYASLRWKAFTLDLGQKHQPLDFKSDGLGSLSATGGHLVWSGNALAMPGCTLSLDPVAVPFTGRKLWIYGSYGDYSTMDQRFVSGALVHSMKAFVRVDIGERLQLHAGLDHVAMWGGTHPEHGAMPVTFSNYIRMATGRHAGADGSVMDQLNVIGDQRGSEMLRVCWRGDGWRLDAQHEKPYDDRSGMRFTNFPDGVNTIHFARDRRDAWVSDVLFEYQYTMYQSGPIYGEAWDEDGNDITPEGVSKMGNDNYFNNLEYRSGWTHHGRTIGNPLFFAARRASDGVVYGVSNNRLKAHHLALAGRLFHVSPYRVMLTYSRNYGAR